MTQILMVGVGGFVGSVLRYLLFTWVNHRFGQALNSLGTLAVNLVGCLLIGFFVGFFAQKTELPPELKLLLVTGLLGGFTTFSAFGLESYHFYKSGELGLFALNLGLNVVLGVVLVAFGLYLSESIFK